MSGDDRQAVAMLSDRLRALAPLVAAHRDQIDVNRRLPAPIIDALFDVGAFRLWLPARLGGYELSPLGFMAVVEAASALDGSIGWLVGNGGGMSRAAGYLPESTAREWFAVPRAFVAAATGAVGTAKPVAGGYLVSGQWPFASGIHHATRVMGLCTTRPDAPGQLDALTCCCLRPKDVEIIDNWHVSGLRGTGSCDFKADEVFVSSDCAHSFLHLQPRQPGDLYRLPAISAFAMTVAVVPLGIAGAALMEFTDLATARRQGGQSQSLKETESVQFQVGRAEAIHSAARRLLRSAIIELVRATNAGGARLIEARARFRVACAHAAENAVTVVDMFAAMAGAVSIFESCSLERRVRDIHAAVKHVAMSSGSYAIAGRIRLGLEPLSARF